MSDDHAAHAISAYGSRINETPNLDRIADGGIRMDSAFCTNSICTPSRASIITGQYSQTNGVLDLTGNIPPERQYLPIEMGKAGYQTAMIGKWHLKFEPAAFDYYCVLPGQGSYFNPIFRIRGEKPWPNNTIRAQRACIFRAGFHTGWFDTLPALLDGDVSRERLKRVLNYLYSRQ